MNEGAIQKTQDHPSPAPPTHAPGGAAHDHSAGAALHDELRHISSFEAGEALLSPVQRKKSEALPAGAAVQLDKKKEATPAAPAKKEPAAVKKVDHMSASSADQQIQAHMGKIVSGLPSGNVAQGKVRIVADAAFRTAYSRYFGDDGEYDSTNAFVERNSPEGGDVVWIHEERGNPGTSLHEAMHLYSNAAYRSDLGTAANEGTTEYFTRYVLRQIGSTLVRSNYDGELAPVNVLAGKAGMTPTAKGYFGGDIAGLEAAAGKAAFATWKAAMKKGDFAAASAAFTAAEKKEAAPTEKKEPPAEKKVAPPEGAKKG